MLNISENQPLIKLKTILQSSYLYYYFLALFLLILSLNYNFIIIFLLIYLYIFKRRYNKFIMFILFVLIFGLFQTIKNKKIPNYINEEVLITNIEKPFDHNVLTIKHQNNKYILTTKENYKVGEYIYVKGKITNFVSLSAPNSFNKTKYYKAKGIYGEIKEYEINSLNQSNFLYSFKNYSNNNLSLFTNDNIDDEFNNSISNLNIYYLISLSGIHIYFLIRIIKKIMFYLDIKSKLQDLIIIILLIILLLISGFTITLIRILIYELLKLIKKHYYNNITNYSLLNLTYFIMILIMPYLLISSSLLISYLIVSVLMLFKDKISSEYKILSQIKLAFLVNLIILPFNNKLNIISVIINPLLIIIIVNIIFPITIINAFLNIKLLTKVITIFENIIIELGKFNFNIILPSLNVFLIILYFILLISSLVFKTRKKIVSIILLLIIVIVPIFKKYYYDPKLYFLDVGQGDSSVYISRDNVLVFDAYRNVSNLLKYEGVYVIDYLVLSHSHLDHTNEAAELLKTFKVRNVIISAYDNYNIKFNTNIIKGKAGLIIKDQDIKIEILSPSKDYYNSNNNSLVFLFSYENRNILYTGDIEYEAESDLLYFFIKEQKRNINILKVAHHGSNTSSYYELIKEIKPSIAIISVGLDNNYNMPNENVINNFISLGTRVYRTDLDGTILYYDNEIILL